MVDGILRMGIGVLLRIGTHPSYVRNKEFLMLEYIRGKAQKVFSSRNQEWKKSASFGPQDSITCMAVDS